MKLATFDVFDTALIRRCGRFDMVYEQLAKRLYPNDACMSEAFLLWRRHAERKLVETSGNHHATLAAIYSTVDTSSFTDYSPEQMANVEKEIESENLTVNPGIRQLIRQKRSEGYTIAFISDMYLGSEFLKAVLLREGCAETTDMVYSSCEQKARKDTGALYQKVKEALQPEHWEHYGNNMRSDVTMARRQGIQATLIDTTYTPIEKKIEEAGRHQQPSTQWSILPAVSRYARIVSGNSDKSAIAADFTGPAYIPYVMSVLTDAHQKGIRRLYFLSRDSYILLKIAEQFKEEYPEIEMRYLFLSRRSLYLPYLFEGNEETYLSAADHHTIVRRDNVDKLLQTLGTDRQEMESAFSITFPYQRIESKAQERDFLDKLFHSDYTPMLQQRAGEQRKLLRDYFRQEGLSDNISSAMVDVGWLGTTRLMVNQILREEGMRETEFYYYGIRGDVLPTSAGRYTSYSRSKILSTALTSVAEHYFSASPYPTTIGYLRDKEGKISPLFPKGKSYQENATISANIQVCCLMAKELVRTGKKDASQLYAWSKLSEDLLINSDIDIDFRPFIDSPDFDAMPFVKRLSMMELSKLVFSGKQITSFDWASIRVTLPRCLWRSAWWTKQLTGRIRRKVYLKYLAGK